MAITRVFIDESGDTNLNINLEGVSSHFIIVAVLVKEEKERELRREIRDFRKKYFQESEMKSAKIGSIDRRVRIIADLIGINFAYIPFIVNKREILKESGLGYKKSFLKYLHDLLHRELKNNYDHIEIFADNMGSEGFMQEFKTYVDSKSEQTLFNTRNFSFCDSKDDELIQLADIISGTLLHIYDEKKTTKYSKNLRVMLNQKNLGSVFWPPSFFKSSPDTSLGNVDRVISNIALDRVNGYIEADQTSDKDMPNDKLIVAKYLRFRFLDSQSNDYILAKELIDNLEAITGRKISSHELRTRIIAPLRDEQVIIASSSMGYKLPKKLPDIYDFLENGQKMIVPMLDRVKKCRDIVKKATIGELDIVDRDETRKLSILVNASDNEQGLH